MNAMLNAWLRPILGITGILLGMVVAPAMAQAPGLAMLGGLRSGSWDLKVREGAGQNGKICVRTGRELIQIRHRAASCNHTVVEDTPTLVRVHYACPGNGYGQTTIRRESTGLVQISTQGVEGRAPFNFNAEARYARAC